MKTSEWLFELDGYIECKNCGYHTSRSPTPYCPYCGYFMTNNENAPNYDERPHCIATKEIEMYDYGRRPTQM